MTRAKLEDLCMWVMLLPGARCLSYVTNTQYYIGKKRVVYFNLINPEDSVIYPHRPRPSIRRAKNIPFAEARQIILNTYMESNT